MLMLMWTHAARSVHTSGVEIVLSLITVAISVHVNAQIHMDDAQVDDF